MNEITPERFDQLAAGAEHFHTTVHHLPADLHVVLLNAVADTLPHLAPEGHIALVTRIELRLAATGHTITLQEHPMNEIPEHLRRNVQRIVDGSTFTAGGPITNTDPAGVLHIPRSLLAAAKNSGSIDDLVRLIETNAAWDADGPIIPPRIVIDDDLDAALMAARAEADDREFEARYELSVARLDHWASNFRNCDDGDQFSDDELDQLSHLLTWAANQINAATAETRAEAAAGPQPPPEPPVELSHLIDSVIESARTVANNMSAILDRFAERLGDRP